jgi:hypothetical protein
MRAWIVIIVTLLTLITPIAITSKATLAIDIITSTTIIPMVRVTLVTTLAIKGIIFVTTHAPARATDFVTILVTFGVVAMLAIETAIATIATDSIFGSDSFATTLAIYRTIIAIIVIVDYIIAIIVIYFCATRVASLSVIIF